MLKSLKLFVQNVYLNFVCKSFIANHVCNALTNVGLCKWQSYQINAYRRGCGCKKEAAFDGKCHRPEAMAAWVIERSVERLPRTASACINEVTKCDTIKQIKIQAGIILKYRVHE